MFYFLYGDIPKAADKANGIVASLLKRQPDAARFKLDSDNWSRAEFQEFLGGQGLFAQRYIVELRRLFENDEAKETILDSLEELKESPNVFIWVEAEATKKELDAIETYAEKVQDFVVATKTVKPQFNIFSLGDALGARDKKKLWMQYIDAQQYFAVEEIHGTLFWQVKSMLLAAKTKSAKEADMKPFPYNKAKGYLKKYSEKELIAMSRDLLKVSHEARRGTHNFAIALERWVLSI